MQQKRSGEQEPNRAADVEQAEGSRETVQQGGQGKAGRHRGKAGGASGTGGGITNRDLEREQAEQDHLPPRGGGRDQS